MTTLWSIRRQAIQKFFLKKDLLFYFIWINIWPAYMYCTVCVSAEARRRYRSPGTGVTESCESPSGGKEPNWVLCKTDKRL